MGSDSIQEIKKRGNWRIARLAKNEVKNLTKPVHNHDAAHRNSKASHKTELKTIESKWGREKAEYICQYNCSEKYAKIVRKACLRWSWKQAHELVKKSILQYLERITRHITLSCLTIYWANISEPGVTLPSGAPVNERRLELLNVTITEPWRDIIPKCTRRR